MNFLSFKKIKFLKASSSVQPPKNETSSAGKNGRKRSSWKDVIQSPFLWLVVFVLAISYLISYLPSKSLPELRVGEIADRDIIAPMDLTIEDTETTEAKRREAAETVFPVYTFDQNVFLNTTEKIGQLFLLGRDWKKTHPASKPDLEGLQRKIFENFEIEVSPEDLGLLFQAGFPSSLEETLVNLIGKALEKGTLLSKSLFIHREEERGLALARPGEAERVFKVNEVLDMKESKDLLAREVGTLDISRRYKPLLINLSHLILVPNISFNKVETEARKQRDAGRVEAIFYRIKKDKVIIRKGDEITLEAVRQIRIINQNVRTTPTWLINFLGTLFLFALLIVTFWYYLKSLQESGMALRTFILLGTTLLLSILLYKLSMFLSGTFSQSSTFFLLQNRESYNFAFPFQFGTLLFAFLTTIPITLIYVIINSLVVGHLFRADFFMMLYALMGGLAAIYGTKYFQRQKRTTTLRAGLFLVAPVNVFLLIAFTFIKERSGDLDLFVSEVLMGIIGGIFSAALAFLLLPFVETLFGFVTQARLLDLTNSDQAVLKRMALEAPGSYHHSLIVTSLAEKAAEVLKLDTLLVKAGALYHDIGKVRRPEYFIENKSRNIDMHRQLTPSMSTRVIVSHVKDGLELAKKLRLPQKLQEIIAQHHGKTLVKYFFHKAKEKYDPEMQKVDDEDYRYPGPVPQGKEAALVMLADAVEAASRSLRSPTRDNLKRVIQDIFDNFIQDGQLEDSAFSIRELRTIASSFLSTLDSIYHPRISYPGFDFESKPKKETPAGTNGRNTEQTKKTPGQHKEA